MAETKSALRETSEELVGRLHKLASAMNERGKVASQWAARPCAHMDNSRFIVLAEDTWSDAKALQEMAADIVKAFGAAEER
jgi:hypothetical protein